MAAPQVLPQKSNALETLFQVKKPVIGVIHLKPLPGAPRYNGQAMKEVYDAAVADALTLSRGGVDGIIVENASDLPFARPENIGPETVAALTAACLAVRNAVDTPIGITCVANGAIPALAIAKAVGARWVRVNQWANAYIANEGFINGPAAEQCAIARRSAPEMSRSSPTFTLSLGHTPLPGTAASPSRPPTPNRLMPTC